VNGGESDPGLSRLLIERSRGCAGWMAQHGVRFQAALRGTLHLSRTNAFFLGGGKALAREACWVSASPALAGCGGAALPAPLTEVRRTGAGGGPIAASRSGVDASGAAGSRRL
jgi:hypothetical protein